MERLTEKIEEHYIARQDRLNGKIIGNQLCLDKLGEYENLEEQGLLLRLPCKVGDTVYHVVQGRIVEVSNVDLFFLLLSVAENRFNNSVFLTQEEAEQKLKEMESK